MYTIGEFSKIVMLSPKTLRYYDDINIFKPSYIDDYNNYRYYSLDQINDLLMILKLKQCGLSLNEIKKITHNNDFELLEILLHKKLDEFNKRIADIKLLKKNALYTLNYLQTAKPAEMSYSFSTGIKEKKLTTVAFIKKTISINEYNQEIMKTIISLFNILNSKAIESVGSVICIFNDRIFNKKTLGSLKEIPSMEQSKNNILEEDMINIEICIPIEDSICNTSLQTKQVFGKKYAYTIVSGEYNEEIGIMAYMKLLEYSYQENYVFDGPAAEIYVLGPGDTNNPDEYVTEICIPIK